MGLDSYHGLKKHRIVCRIAEYAALFVLLWIVGQTQNIVGGYLIKVGKADEHIRGNVPLAQLIVAVYALGTV